MISQNQIQSSQLEPKEGQSRSNKAPFSPHLTEILEIKRVPTCNAWNAESATCLYSQKHNVIFVCPNRGTVQFYDADTLLPDETREMLEIGETITQISFWPETDEYLLGCIGGTIYSYNASSQTLKRLRNEKDMTVFSIAFINSRYYVFSLFGSDQIHIGDLQQQNGFLRSNSRNFDPICFGNLAKKNALVSGLFNGSLVIYRTDRLPTKLPIFSSIKPPKAESSLTVKIDSAKIGSSELIITYGSNGKIRVWNLTRRRMRLIRMIKIEQTIRSGVYIEDSKMLGVIGPGGVKFISLITGKLVSTLDIGIRAEKIFSIKEKNALGIVDQQQNKIQLVKLCS